MPFEPLFLEEQKRRLVTDKERIEAELMKFAIKDGDEFKVVWNEKGATDEDNADESRDYADAVALCGTLSKEWEDIIAALKKIEEGTYGLCTQCKTDIAQRRLEARPMAILCIKCQQRQERI